MKRLGSFTLFLKQLFVNRESPRVYGKLFFEECIRIGLDSIFIVSIVAFFVGAVSAVQTANNMTSPFVPKYIVSLIVRDMLLLEIAPTFIGVVFAGKVGSNIAGGLGTMKITEQIDALEVMGINSVSYLVLPKVLACVAMLPMLTTLAAFLGIYGGYVASILGGWLTPEEYIYGLRFEFIPFNVTFALIKALVFGFLVSTISSFLGYNTVGGALEVGRSSTKAVTNSCIAILVADFLLAQLLI
ncbi:MlaE family ABC transporter permease [Sediminitomix flava]|uniref:MlaE family ABC transporter permease n=1 Tax=Sediminitomix flava TaxID=379075 RepID=UPI000D6CF811|nr:ABC transporter permease [Sediminitomix flava]